MRNPHAALQETLGNIQRRLDLFYGRNIKVHWLKCADDPFVSVWVGRKTCEFRINDRDFKEGDLLVLQRFDDGQIQQEYMVVIVTHIQTGFGIPEGYVMMSIKQELRSA